MTPSLLARVGLRVPAGSAGRQSMKRADPTGHGRRIGYVDVVGQSLPLALQRSTSRRTDLVADGMSPSRPAVSTDVVTVFRHGLAPGERAALLSWAAFSVTFAGVRGLTYSIRVGWGPFRNLSLGGEHLHHYIWGIGMLAGVGGVAVHGEDRTRRHPVVSLIYGAGLALVIDEFALLLDLRDVYWAKEGRVSVDLAIGSIAVTGTALAAQPLLRGLRNRQRLQRAQ